MTWWKDWSVELAIRTLALPLARRAHNHEANCDFEVDGQKMITQQDRQSDQQTDVLNTAGCVGVSTLQACNLINTNSQKMNM